jgi:hypothetical protein
MCRISLLGVFVLVVATVDTLNDENMLFRPFLRISLGLLPAGYHCQDHFFLQSCPSKDDEGDEEEGDDDA